MSREAKPRVLLADDHLQLLSALETLLENACDLIGCATTVAELVEKAEAEQPDVLVVDFRLPDGTGIEACRQVLAAAPGAAIIILTAMDDDEVAAAAREAGAFGYVSKYSAHSQLLPAILAAYETRQAAQTGSAAGLAQRTSGRRSAD
jgi:two-component system response regulator DevR